MTVLTDMPVVITGAGSGLGRAYALDCVRAGAQIVVNDVAQAGVAETLALIEARVGSGRAVGHVGSVGDWAAAGELVDRCVDTFGSIRGLVNNAGILHAAAIWDETEYALREIVEVNLLGTMFCGAHAMRRFRAQGGGSIVNVTSSVQLGSARVSAYGATKGAITSLTYAWAIEGRPHSIRVNAVSPLARTRILDSWDGNPEQQRARLSYPEPDLVAPVVAFLLSAESAPMSGQVLRADGSSVYPMKPAEFRTDRLVAASAAPTSILDAFT